MARTTKKSALSSGQVSLVNRFASKVAKDNGLAATSLNSAGLPKTVGGAEKLLATVNTNTETQSDNVAALTEILANSEGATKRDVLAVIAPAKTTKRKAASKTRKATVTQKPKAEAGAKRQPVRDLDAAAARIAKMPEGVRQWWAKAHADQIKAVGLKADGSVVKGGKVAKAMADA